MTLHRLSLGEAAVVLEAADPASAELLACGFPELTRATARDDLIGRVSQLDDDRFCITLIGPDGETPDPAPGRDRAGALSMLSGLVADALAKRSTTGVALHAAAVRFGDRVVLLPGASGAGKSSASVRLALAGGDLLTDELAWVGAAQQVEGLLRPIGLKRPVDTRLSTALELPEIGPGELATPFIRLLDARNIPNQQDHAASVGPSRLALIVFPTYDLEQRSGVHALSPIAATERLLGQRWVTPAQRGSTFHQLADLARGVPSVEVVGSQLDDIVSIVEALLRGDALADLDLDEPDEPTALARPAYAELDPLSRLAVDFGCDKWIRHRFTPDYHRRLAARRHGFGLIAEISTRADLDNDAFHNSLRMWRSYFPHADVIGAIPGDADVDLGPRIEIRSLGVEGGMYTAITDATGPFDLVIHRGAADLDSARAAFDAIFPRLRDGGMYAIELEPGCSDVTSLFSELVDDLHLPERRAVDERAAGSRHAETIRGIDVTRNLCIVERGANRRRSAVISRLDEPGVQHTVDVLVEATKHLPDGWAEVSLARLHHAIRERESALVWARSALAAGSTDPWVLTIVKQHDLAVSPPHS